MTLTIQLTPSEEARLAAAAAREGLALADLARRVLTEHLPPVAQNGEPEDPTLALFAQWEREDATMTPEEVADENRQWEELKGNLNQERDRAGARRVF